MLRLLPSRIVAGDTLEFQFTFDSDLDFGLAPVVTLSVKTSAGIVRTVAGSFNTTTEEWEVVADANETAAWSGGTAVYQVKIASADGVTAATVDSDIIIVDAPLDTVLTTDELALKTLQDIRQFRLTNHQTTIYYMIADRQVQLMTLKELDDEIERLKNILAMKRNKGRFVEHPMR